MVDHDEDPTCRFCRLNKNTWHFSSNFTESKIWILNYLQLQRIISFQSSTKIYISCHHFQGMKGVFCWLTSRPKDFKFSCHIECAIARCINLGEVFFVGFRKAATQHHSRSILSAFLQENPSHKDVLKYTHEIFHMEAGNDGFQARNLLFQGAPIFRLGGVDVGSPQLP